MSYKLTKNLIKLIQPDGQKILLNLRQVSSVYISNRSVVFVPTENAHTEKVIFPLPTVDEANRVFDDVEKYME